MKLINAFVQSSLTPKEFAMIKPSLSLVTRSCFAVGLVMLLMSCSPSAPDAGSGSGQPPGQAATSAQKEALCKHEVAEKLCPICHPEVLKDPNILLCKEHGNIPEELCTACHPELKAKYKTCEHELPPALCPKCRSKVEGSPPAAKK